MKKFFAFVIAMAMTVVANAGMITLTPAGDTTLDAPGTVDFTITSDTLLMGMNVVVTVTGDGSIVESANGAWDAPSAGFPRAEGNMVEFAAGTFGNGVMGNIATFTVMANSGVVDIVLSGAGTQGGSMQMDFMTPDVGGMATVTVVPEPMTMSLLGLGGLVAARRRRA